jgi:hypothetical protein
MLTGAFPFERVSRRVEDNAALPTRRRRTRAALPSLIRSFSAVAGLFSINMVR